jgi:hypothetical protein
VLYGANIFFAQNAPTMDDTLKEAHKLINPQVRGRFSHHSMLHLVTFEIRHVHPVSFTTSPLQRKYLISATNLNPNTLTNETFQVKKRNQLTIEVKLMTQS